jgi:hypothetical protein
MHRWFSAQEVLHDSSQQQQQQRNAPLQRFLSLANERVFGRGARRVCSSAPHDIQVACLEWNSTYVPPTLAQTMTALGRRFFR